LLIRTALLIQVLLKQSNRFQSTGDSDSKFQQKLPVQLYSGNQLMKWAGAT